MNFMPSDRIDDGLQRATFAAGCFWGVEASLREVEGVVRTRVGYTGGKMAKPRYEDVKTGQTGHADSFEQIPTELYVGMKKRAGQEAAA